MKLQVKLELCWNFFLAKNNHPKIVRTKYILSRLTVSSRSYAQVHHGEMNLSDIAERQFILVLTEDFKMNSSIGFSIGFLPNLIKKELLNGMFCTRRLNRSSSEVSVAGTQKAQFNLYLIRLVVRKMVLVPERIGLQT
ncbi:hypothetical protein HRJ45_10125 [Vibrio coralliilyticus]|nr:hypothetical protein [Vibrio coralliilyticus]